MFGYITPLAGELKVREFELYKSFYCGLCKTMGKKISRFSRVTLSYDMVFLVLLRVALTGENIENMAFRCKLKPAKKRRYVKSNESLLYSSCVAANLSYYKYKDDIADAAGKFKKFLLKAFFPAFLLFSHMKKKSGRHYPDLGNLIAPPLAKLSELEKQNCESIDQTASCFAELMENIMAFGLAEPKCSEIAKTIGRSLGRWLYIADALDDFSKDLKKGNYNPFVARYENKERLTGDINMVKYALTSNLIEMDRAFSLLETSSDSCAGIVSNIIKFGLREKQEQLFIKLQKHE